MQAEHQYTLRELASVKAALQRRDDDLHDLQSRLQDQDSAACEYHLVTTPAALHLPARGCSTMMSDVRTD